MKSIFMGEIRVKRYYSNNGNFFGGYSPRKFEKENNAYADSIYKKNEHIETLDKEAPFLRVGDYYYLESIDKTVSISSARRTTEGNIMYYTDYVIETVEDQETTRSLEKVKELDKIDKEIQIEGLINENKELYEKLETLTNKINRIEKGEIKKGTIREHKKSRKPSWLFDN